MAVPSSPPINLSGSIVAEFGGPGNLTSYYRGGGYVPNHPGNSGIPSSGTIRILQLAGGIRSFTSGTATCGHNFAAGTGTKGKSRDWFGGYIGPKNSLARAAVPPSGTFGDVSSSNTFGYSGGSLTQATCVGVYDTDGGVSFNSYVVFTGNLVNWAWNTVTANGRSFSRASSLVPAGTYVSANNITYWSYSIFSGQGFFNSRTSGTFTWSIDPA